MKTAYSYVRFSTPEQAKGNSLARQKEASDRWCRENGYTLAKDVFFDRGKSGYSGATLQAKGELKRFLDLVEDGTIPPGAVLIVENFDRLSRLKPVQSYTLFLNLINAGIGLVFTLSYDQRVITEDLLNKEPGLLQMILGECIRANAESARKSQLVSNAKQAKLARIRNGEKVPHNNVPKYFIWDAEKRDYVHHPAHKPLVQEIVRGFLRGQSLYRIARNFNLGKVKTFRRGFEWSACSVRAILRNPCLVGEYLGRKDYLPRIIEDEDFNRVQVLLSQNKDYRGQQGKFVNIFRGLAFCTCGAPMNATVQSDEYRMKVNWKRAYRYLRCAKRSTGKSCPSKPSMRLDLMEEDFFGRFLLQDPKTMSAETDTAEQKALNAAIAARQTRISQLTQQITKLATANDGLDVPELKLELTKLAQERTAERTELDSLSLQKIQTENRPQQFDDLRAIVQNLEREKDVKLSKKYFHQYIDGVLRIAETLKDNTLRLKVRAILPTLVGKIVVNTDAGTFEVLSRAGKRIYRSQFIAAPLVFRDSKGRYVAA